MKDGDARPLTIAVGGAGSVSALWLAPARARACYVFAHGAGAGMTHPSMAAFAEGLAAREVATLRFQFPYMEKGSKRPDLPAVAQAAVRAAVDEAARLGAGLPLFAGGRSFGGRMTSQAQARAPLAGVRGLVFVGFPPAPAGRPGPTASISKIAIPMLFLRARATSLPASTCSTRWSGALGPKATARAVRRRRSFVPCPRAQRRTTMRRCAKRTRCHRRLDDDRHRDPVTTVEERCGDRRHMRRARQRHESLLA
jgi:predicted alpha/beta-hydrolase family hydrolase